MLFFQYSRLLSRSRGRDARIRLRSSVPCCIRQPSQQSLKTAPILQTRILRHTCIRVIENHFQALLLMPRIWIQQGSYCAGLMAIVWTHPHAQSLYRVLGPEGWLASPDHGN